MSVLKMLLVLGVCAAQVFFITSFFTSGKGGAGKTMPNPFVGRNAI